MKILVTGTSGHLGEAIARTFIDKKIDYVGADLKASDYTQHIGDLSDKIFVENIVKDADYIIHSATLHKPHVATHSKEAFFNSNVLSTLHLLNASIRYNIKGFIFTSTTSTFGDALKPGADEPAIWVTEKLRSQPKNIYGVTKNAAEDLCQLFYRNENLPSLILKTSRFFWEPDDDYEKRTSYPDLNIKANEYVNRRLDVEDAVAAHLLAIQRVEEIGFAKYIISATTPFKRSDIADLNKDAGKVLEKLFPDYAEIYSKKGWKMFPKIGRVYDNAKARTELGWNPKYNFKYILECIKKDVDFKSPLAASIGIKGYHNEKYTDGIYPVDQQ